jgi:hypothetical protein
VLVPGVIGGAVVAAARRGAGLTRSGLARSLSVRPATVRGWESGEVPLYCVPYAELRRLALAVGRASSSVAAVFNRLLMAGQLDLLMSEMLVGSADYAELPPIGSGTVQGAVAGDLLAWGFRGIVPDCYRGFAQPGCLYGASDRLRIAGILGDLRIGANSELAEYATVLLALTSLDGEVVRSPGRRGLRRSDRPAGWWFRRVAR